MRLDNDGHLRVYEWILTEWKEVADIFKEYFRDCDYPLVCGNYGLCSRGLCTCPSGENETTTTYFEQTDNRQPALGCSERTPLSCGASQYHSFLELNDTTYFTFTLDIVNIDSEKCKQACLQNCSCKAAIFRYGSPAKLTLTCFKYKISQRENHKTKESFVMDAKELSTNFKKRTPIWSKR
ncbi:hypothetical protein Dsin_031996 [Dipteronia sinensis]|uniref:Apple domain-containing protein n=1 Tax=Dipteronia sinensis TaxID=43782 RepID=A0AAD9ZNF5_9ROSI|nr:hypothetical protein Dsin_031996 [Dipteronia sinensis]